MADLVSETEKVRDANKALSQQLGSTHMEMKELRTNLQSAMRDSETDGLTQIANRKCFERKYTPAIVTLLGHAQTAANLSDRLALCQGYLGLSKLADDLFRGSFAAHSVLLQRGFE